MSEFAIYPSDLLQERVLLFEKFNDLARLAGRPMTHQLAVLQGRRLLSAFHDPDAFRRRAERHLYHLVQLGRAYPDLTVGQASAVACQAALMQHPLTNDAIRIVLDHAEAAYKVHPIETKGDLASCWIAAQNEQLKAEISIMGAYLEPETVSGPWGLRPEGMDFLLAQAEKYRSWRERFGDWKHRLLNPPGPHDITISS